MLHFRTSARRPLLSVTSSPGQDTHSPKDIYGKAQATAVRLETVEGQISTGNMTIHETGGTVRPRRSRYLTIPLPAAMDSRGVPLRRRARDWDNTFVARSRRGNLLIFRRDGLGLTPLYLLKPSVRIKPRLGLEDAVVENGLSYFERRAFEEISRELAAT